MHYTGKRGTNFASSKINTNSRLKAKVGRVKPHLQFMLDFSRSLQKLFTPRNISTRNKSVRFKSKCTLRENFEVFRKFSLRVNNSHKSTVRGFDLCISNNILWYRIIKKEFWKICSYDITIMKIVFNELSFYCNTFWKCFGNKINTYVYDSCYA